MTTSREKISSSELETFKAQLPEDLSIAFGDEVTDPFIESALYVFTGDSYEDADLTWFLDWSNGRWHVSLQTTTYDYRNGELDVIGQLIANNYSSHKND